MENEKKHPAPGNQDTDGTPPRGVFFIRNVFPPSTHDLTCGTIHMVYTIMAGSRHQLGRRAPGAGAREARRAGAETSTGPATSSAPAPAAAPDAPRPDRQRHPGGTTPAQRPPHKHRLNKNIRFVQCEALNNNTYFVQSHQESRIFQDSSEPGARAQEAGRAGAETTTRPARAAAHQPPPPRRMRRAPDIDAAGLRLP